MAEGLFARKEADLAFLGAEPWRIRQQLADVIQRQGVSHGLPRFMEVTGSDGNR